MVIIAILLFSGCFAKILMIFLYNKFFEDSLHVADCKSELIKQIKLRYGNQIKLELPIQDAEKFVARYVYQYSKIIKFINVLDMFSMILMLAGIALNYEKQYFSTEVLFIAMFIYISLGLLINGDKKERIIIGNIADYLANNMNTRMAAREHRVQVKEECVKDQMEGAGIVELPEKSVVKVEETAKETGNSFKNLFNGKNSDENAIIEEVLREFLQA